MYSKSQDISVKNFAKFFIENFTQPNDIIYDPFMGCGTTGVVAKQNNRRYIGSEICQEYCDIANKRIGELNEKESS